MCIFYLFFWDKVSQLSSWPWTSYVVKVEIKLLIHQPLPPVWWDCRHVPLSQHSVGVGTCLSITKLQHILFPVWDYLVVQLQSEPTSFFLEPCISHQKICIILQTITLSITIIYQNSRPCTMTIFEHQNFFQVFFCNKIFLQ